jgi:2-polyprenyl-3-methyl-5-hydroxy-6-metoxy-1,4-benzoquinol methylase
MMRIGLAEDRFDVIKKYVMNKEVLDCGCVGGAGSSSEDWLHGRLAKISKSVLGVDIQKEWVEKLKGMGYDVVYGDVATIDLKKKFDVIVAGELIEHLSNQGLFLENMKKHLKKRGFLILTTPNALQIPTFLMYHLRLKRQEYSGHICLHTSDTIKVLAERHGFDIVELWYYFGKPPKELRGL